MRTSKVPPIREWSYGEADRFLGAYGASMMPFILFCFYMAVKAGQ
jgi:hypothetical protein